jgi:oligoribonuclease
VLVWIDLEATSLCVHTQVLLEVAAIMTDDRLREVGRFHRVVHWPPAEQLASLEPDSPGEAFRLDAELMGIDRVVIEMHAKNGLWTESARSPHRLTVVDNQFAEFLAQTATATDPATGQQTKAQIAGSSIWFDRLLMISSLPRALEQLHYRCVDVTTLNELARRFWPGLLGGKPCKREIHRSMSDIEDSLELCRYYVEQIARGERSC